MNTNTALLAAIAALPDERTPRLAYADWLGEFGVEDDWQNYLDSHPDHHEMRIRFSEWLRDRGDSRADGYLALGRLGRRPNRMSDGKYTWTMWGKSEDLETTQELGTPACLVGDWWELCETMGGRRERRECEDAAAREFLNLCEDRRAELLGYAQREKS